MSSSSIRGPSSPDRHLTDEEDDTSDVSLRPMKTLIALLCSLTCAFAGPTVLYVSESGDKRISVWSMEESTGEITRVGEETMPAGTGSLALSPDLRHLHASVRSSKQLASLDVDVRSGALSNLTLSEAGFNASYVHVDRTGRWLLAASYTEGVVGVSAIESGHVKGRPIQVRETGSAAHCIRTDRSNRFAFVPHVGRLNKVEQLRFDAKAGTLESNSPPHLAGGEGEGPRHMQFHPNGRWVYFVNEQGKSVTLCDLDPEKGTLTARQSVPTVPEDQRTQGTCADIHVSADGRFVYASNRGHNSIATFAVDGVTGMLTPKGQTPTEPVPRSFCLVSGDRFLVSAGETSNRLIVFGRDAASGMLTPLKRHDCGKGPAWVMGVTFE